MEEKEKERERKSENEATSFEGGFSTENEKSYWAKSESFFLFFFFAFFDRF